MAFRHPALQAFAAALALRLLWALATPHSIPFSDAAWYVDAAARLAETGSFTDRGRLTAYWPVGYPFFLSLFHHLPGPSLLYAKAAQILLSAGTCALLASLALRHGASRPAALLAGLSLAAFPSAISLATVFFSETLFAFLLLLGFLLGSARSLALAVPGAGLVLGAACFVRPLALLLLPLVFLPLLLNGKHRGYLAGTAGLFLLAAAMSLPWGLRNQKAFGEYVAWSTNGGVNLHIGHNPLATGTFVETPEIRTLDTIENEALRSRAFRDLAVDHILAHPGREAVLLLKKAALLLQEREPVYFSFVTDPVDRTFPVLAKAMAGLGNVAWIAAFALFLLTPWWAPGPGRGMRLAAGLAFWVQVLFYCLFFVTDRYKFPAMPFLVLALALTLPQIPPIFLRFFAGRRPQDSGHPQSF